MTAFEQILGALDETSSLPLYKQLQRTLRHAIETPVLGPDHALPPKRDLATAEFTQSYNRGDIYDFVAELSIAT